MTRVIDETLVEIVVLSLWLGAAALFVSAVAPAAFAVMPTRTLAGALVGRVLPALFYAGMAVGLMVVALEVFAGRAITSRRGLAGSVIIVVCVIAQFAVAARLARLRASIGGPLDSLPLDDVRRAAFGRLHGVSVALLGVAMLAATTGLVFAMRALSSRT